MIPSEWTFQVQRVAQNITFQFSEPRRETTQILCKTFPPKSDSRPQSKTRWSIYIRVVGKEIKFGGKNIPQISGATGNRNLKLLS